MDKYSKGLNKKLIQRQEEDSFRGLKIWKKDHIDFFSNDYLGISKISDPPCNLEPGSGGSRLLGGNHSAHQELENLLAEFYGLETLVFNSGFDANLALFSAIPQKGELILFDAQSHNSIRKGIQLSNARSLKFKHNDFADLRIKLESAKEDKIYIAVESLYSMDGSILDLEKLVKLSKEYKAAIILDEAHSNGVYGVEGQGLANHLGLEKDIFATMCGFGKAFGRHGAAVVGSQILKDYLINFGSSFIYSTAHSPKHIHSLKNSLKLIKEAKEARAKLSKNIDYFQSQLKIQQNISTNKSPIQFLQVSGNQKAKELSEKMFQHKINIAPVLHPTVPKGFEGLRLCLHSYNTKEEIDLLLTLL